MRYKIGQVAKMACVSRETLRAWDKRGILVPKRTPTGHRFYTQEQVDKLLAGETEAENVHL